MKVTKQDKDEFALFCRQATDAQLRNIFEKEKTANRKTYAAIAKEELVRRGLT